MSDHRGDRVSRQLLQDPESQASCKGPNTEKYKIELQGSGKGTDQEQFIGGVGHGCNHDGKDSAGRSKGALDISPEQNLLKSPDTGSHQGHLSQGQGEQRKTETVPCGYTHKCSQEKSRKNIQQGASVRKRNSGYLQERNMPCGKAGPYRCNCQSGVSNEP